MDEKNIDLNFKQWKHQWIETAGLNTILVKKSEEEKDCIEIT